MNYCEYDSNYKELALNIENFFSNSKNLLFQGRNSIKIVEFNRKKVAIKYFKIPNFINKIAYRFFRDSKAKRSYKNAKKLIYLGINTPKPIAYVEKPKALFFDKSYYICEFFDYDFEIRDVLKSSNFKDRETILKEFVKFSYNLHNLGVYHIDYSPGNVLIKRDNNSYIFSIVDVNRMKFIDFSNSLRFKNLSRFSTSIEDLEFIAKEYAKISSIDENFAILELRKYHNKHQDYLKRKQLLRKLKGK